MKEYVPVVVSVIAGIFAVVSAYISWRLKQKSDSNERQLRRYSDQHSEIKALYIKIHEIFEELIKNTKMHGGTNLNSRFSNLTAEVRLLASEDIIEQYVQVADLYQEWAPIYLKAYPAPVNGHHIIQAPDPTLKFKEPEKDAYDRFYQKYQSLIERMRKEIKQST